MFQSGSNIGIGTTSPEGRLDIQSPSGNSNVVYMRGGTYSNISFATGIRFLQPASTINANRQFRFTSGDTSLTIQGIDGSGTDTADTHLIIQPNGGNVGIGTTNPIGSTTRTLQVWAAAASSAGIRVSGDGRGGVDLLQDVGGSCYLVVRDYQPLGLGTNGVDYVRITADGKVGIGLTNPNDYANGFFTVSRTLANDDVALVLRNGASPVAGAVQGTIINFINDSGTNTALAYIQTRTNDGGTDGETSMRFGTWNGSVLRERMRISPAGNVGINVTSSLLFPLQVMTNAGSPPQALQLTTRDWTTSTGSAFQFGFGASTGNTYSEIRALSTGYSQWDNLVLQSNGGNVGIGTTNPGAKLDVDGDIRFSETGRIEGRAYPYTTTVGAGADATTTYITAGSTTNYQSRIVVAGGSATNPNTIIMSTTSTERMRINASGNVGIGTTNPDGKFDARGNAYFGLNATDGAIHIRGYNSALSRFNTNAGLSGNYNGLRIDSNVNNSNSLSNWVVDIGGNDQITRPGTTDTFNIGRVPSGGSLSTYLLINSSGNVGIGKTNPSYKLDVAGDINASGTDPILYLTPSSGTYIFFQKLSTGNGDYLRLYDGTTYSMTWKGGNVGIGTTNPNAPLQIQGSSTDNIGEVLQIYNTSANTATKNSVNIGDNRVGTWGLLLGKSGTNTTEAGYHGPDAAHIINVQNGKLHLGTNNIQRLTILGGGKVGIGTTDPANELTVVGKIESRGNASDPNYAAFLSGLYDSSHGLQLGVKINSATESEILGVYADSGGGNPRTVLNPSNSWKVGIGTTNPQDLLDVNGQIRARTGIRIGDGSGSGYPFFIKTSSVTSPGSSWHDVHVFGQYALTAFMLLVGYENNDGDGANLSAVFVDSGTSSYGEGFSITQLSGSTTLEVRRSTSTLQVRHSSGGSTNQFLTWTLMLLQGYGV